MPAKELVEFVARSLVDDPKVIGRNGSVAKALRTLLKVTAAREGEPISLEIL